MQNETKLTEQESFLIIKQMIETAKREQKDDGKGWIIWGWQLFLASVLTLINLKTRWVSTYFFWNVFGIISLLFLLYTVIKYLFFKTRERVKTYTRDIFQRLNIGFFISLMFIIVAINVGVGPMIGFPLLINLYGFWVLIYGTALNFKPSVIGAFITWALGFAALFVKTFEWVMIIHAAAVLCGYIIPGHIANMEFKKINRQLK
ncbi:MAG TPA: hypothetical protein VN958_21990 [Chitinophagaceae bacterium]|nr:hypothetical protein [Chitinophagaceae bacterium]